MDWKKVFHYLSTFRDGEKLIQIWVTSCCRCCRCFDVDDKEDDDDEGNSGDFDDDNDNDVDEDNDVDDDNSITGPTTDVCFSPVLNFQPESTFTDDKRRQRLFQSILVNFPAGANPTKHLLVEVTCFLQVNSTHKKFTQAFYSYLKGNSS